jgi:hypothetical protein
MVMKARHLINGRRRGRNPLGGIIYPGYKMMAAPTKTSLSIMLIMCSGQITVLIKLMEFNGNDSFGFGTGHDSVP